jgi:polyhydroxyalkanoate synthesis regulator phasin
MKGSVKKFFLLGLGIAAAGVATGLAIKNKDKIKAAVDDLVLKGKLMKEDARILSVELVDELKKYEKKLLKQKKPKGE